MKSRLQTQNTGRVAVMDKAEARKAMAVLEQMYGYFSYEPMPLEAQQRDAA